MMPGPGPGPDSNRHRISSRGILSPIPCCAWRIRNLSQYPESFVILAAPFSDLTISCSTFLALYVNRLIYRGVDEILLDFQSAAWMNGGHDHRPIFTVIDAGSRSAGFTQLCRTSKPLPGSIAPAASAQSQSKVSYQPTCLGHASQAFR